MTTREEAKPILKKFADEVLLKPPFFEYFAALVISTLGKEGANVPPERVDELCFGVGLNKELPSSLQLPEEFEGIPVIMKVTGPNFQH